MTPKLPLQDPEDLAQLRDVTIGFSTQWGNLISWLIRLFSKDFSHVWVRYWHPLYKMFVVIEAGFWGVVEVPYDAFKKKNQNVVELVTPPQYNSDAGLERLGQELAKPYDFKSIFGRLWVFLMRWMGRKVKNPFGDAQSDACVEMAVYYAQAVDASLAKVDPEVETPRSFYVQLVAAGWRPINKI